MQCYVDGGLERRSELTNPPPDPDQGLLDAFADGGRALVALTASSLAQYEGRVTLPQYRALVALRTRGSQQPAQLAERLAVDPSTASPMIQRPQAPG